MKLQEAISQQRINGFVGVLAHMKQTAVKLLQKGS
jgi:sulfur transfer protein SufE